MSKYESPYVKRITDRLDRLEEILKSNGHLSNEDLMEEALYICDRLSVWWRNLKEDEKEFYECAKYALEKKLSWS